MHFVSATFLIAMSDTDKKQLKEGSICVATLGGSIPHGKDVIVAGE